VSIIFGIGAPVTRPLTLIFVAVSGTSPGPIEIDCQKDGDISLLYLHSRS
jgi:hypothetical protein